jgi:hypothetical protein
MLDEGMTSRNDRESGDSEALQLLQKYFSESGMGMFS